MSEVSVYPLRLPKSLKKDVTRLSKQDGSSINQFVVTAVASRVAALETAAFFEGKRSRADLSAFDRIMARSGGRKPVRGDELPK